MLFSFRDLHERSTFGSAQGKNPPPRLQSFHPPPPIKKVPARFSLMYAVILTPRASSSRFCLSHSLLAAACLLTTLYPHTTVRHPAVRPLRVHPPEDPLNLCYRRDRWVLIYTSHDSRLYPGEPSLCAIKTETCQLFYDLDSGPAPLEEY